MTNLAVIYDPEMELGAIIDADDMRALGPVGGGPNGREELAQFVAIMPPQVFSMKPPDLVAAWMQFWQANFQDLYREPDDVDTHPVVETDGAGSDDSRLAEHEAQYAGDGVPPPAPADSDREVDTGAAGAVGGPLTPAGESHPPQSDEVAPYEGECFACNGTGTVPGVPGGDPVQCNLCHGTGRVAAATAQ